MCYIHNRESYSATGKKIVVKMMDILHLMRENRITTGDYVIMKLDIEGSEYEIVRKLIVTGTLSKYIDQIAIEW